MFTSSLMHYAVVCHTIPTVGVFNHHLHVRFTLAIATTITVILIASIEEASS
jgi:hypothetical protein